MPLSILSAAILCTTNDVTRDVTNAALSNHRLRYYVQPTTSPVTSRMRRSVDVGPERLYDGHDAASQVDARQSRGEPHGHLLYGGAHLTRDAGCRRVLVVVGSDDGERLSGGRLGGQPHHKRVHRHPPDNGTPLS